MDLRRALKQPIPLSYKGRNIWCVVCVHTCMYIYNIYINMYIPMYIKGTQKIRRVFIIVLFLLF